MTKKFLIETELEKAVSEKKDFLLFYQPQVCLKTGRVVAMEALVRWNHPDKGIILPLAFIPIAEQTGLIIDLGDWVMNKAFHQAFIWKEKFESDFKVSVNLSMRQIESRGFVRKVEKLLHQNHLNPDDVEFEITESMLMHNASKGISVINQLACLGITIALDDFGTGYSSLAILSELPISKLKIDRSFLLRAQRFQKARNILWATVNMGQLLNMQVVVEGAETNKQMALMKEIGSHLSQGFITGRPMSARSATLFLKKKL